MGMVSTKMVSHLGLRTDGICSFSSQVSLYHLGLSKNLDQTTQYYLDVNKCLVAAKCAIKTFLKKIFTEKLNFS